MEKVNGMVNSKWFIYRKSMSKRNIYPLKMSVEIWYHPVQEQYYETGNLNQIMNSILNAFDNWVNRVVPRGPNQVFCRNTLSNTHNKGDRKKNCLSVQLHAVKQFTCPTRLFAILFEGNEIGKLIFIRIAFCL